LLGDIEITEIHKCASAISYASQIGGSSRHSVYPHQLCHVLETLLAKVLKGDLNLTSDMVEHGLRQENAARLGQRF
jgi:hypothetical protein